VKPPYFQGVIPALSAIAARRPCQGYADAGNRAPRGLPEQVRINSLARGEGQCPALVHSAASASDRQVLLHRTQNLINLYGLGRLKLS
jgi:hypothetical protein